MGTMTWTDAAALDELFPGEVMALDFEGGHEVAFYRLGDEVWATANACTHGPGRLCDGFLEGHEIECPLHQGRFDIRSGKALCAPLTQGLRTYPVKIESGRVYVALE